MFWDFLPLVVGISIVIQSGLNEKILEEHNLLYSIFYNNLVFITLSLLLILIGKISHKIEEPFFSFEHFASLSWWYVIPGLLGFIVVAGTTLSFERIDASKSILLIVNSQYITSLLWDKFQLGKNLSIENYVGGFFLILGILISTKHLKII